MSLPLRIQWEAPREPPAGEYLPFTGLPVNRVPRAGAVIGSVAAHVLFFVLCTVVAGNMALWFKADDVDWSRYRVEPLRLHLADPLIFRANAPQKAPAPKPVPRRAGVSAARSGGAAPGSHGRSAPHRLELPAPPEMAINAPVILQPDFRSQIMPLSALPPLAFWAPKSADLPKPPSKEVVVPGRKEERPSQLKLAARPVLAVPNREPAVADINISQPPTPGPVQSPPALPVANSATVPIRVRDATEAQSGSFEVSSGQPVNVLALGAERRDLKDVQVPKGLQNIPNSSGDAGSAPTGEDRSPGASAGTNGTGPKEASAATGPARRDSSDGFAGPNPGTGPAGPNSGAEPAKPNSGASPAPQSQASTPASSAVTGAALATASPRPVPRPETTTINHPSNGNFDVVIMQSATRDDLPDLGGMLSGNPVYTVYLRVGDQKEWLLEYCVPAGGNQQSNPYQINVDDEAPVTPPYPISTTIPNSILGQPITEHIVLHGTLTAGGNLANMKVPGPNNPLAVQILALLGEWQFRPAYRNKKPIDVEVLVVVPARS